jgi:hypothetical protein
MQMALGLDSGDARTWGGVVWASKSLWMSTVAAREAPSLAQNRACVLAGNGKNEQEA